MKLKNINFKIDEEVAKAFKELCKREGFKQGKTVEKIIQEFIYKYEYDKKREESN